MERMTRSKIIVKLDGQTLIYRREYSAERNGMHVVIQATINKKYAFQTKKYTFPSNSSYINVNVFNIFFNFFLSQLIGKALFVRRPQTVH